jgi:hypothetical protein
MPAITISAVNTGTDTLTATAHGLNTGDRFRVRDVGGALPTPLAAVTDYFAIKVDVDNLKVATTSANAFLGTAIDITAAGSGTNTVEYGLPYCIPTALAAAGTQIRSADDNGTWNALVALHAERSGLSQSLWLQPQRTVWLEGRQLDANTTNDGVKFASKITSFGDVAYYVDLPVGTRIISITVFGRDGNSAGVETLSATFVKTDTAGTTTNAGGSSQKVSSGNHNGDTSIGWTTADTGFSPSGYVMTDAPHHVLVELAQTSAAAEVKVYCVKVITG